MSERNNAFISTLLRLLHKPSIAPTMGFVQQPLLGPVYMGSSKS